MDPDHIVDWCNNDFNTSLNVKTVYKQSSR